MMSKELLKALVDVLDDLKLRKNLSEDDALNISDSVLVRAEKAIENYLAQPEQEPLSEDEIFNIGYKAGFAIDHVESDDGESTDYGFIDGDGYIDNDLVFKFVRAIEKACGIGGEE